MRINEHFIRLILLLILIFFTFSCGKKDFRHDYFTVKSILSGNEIVLINNYHVLLNGIQNTEESKAFLTKELLNKKIKFIFDSSAPFKRINPKSKDKSFYAYVINLSGECINSKILKNCCSSLDFNSYISDSLKNYLSYLLLNGCIDIPKDFKMNIDCESELTRLQEACDYLEPLTRDFAVKIAGHSSGKFSIDQICDLFEAIRPPNWKYVNDPKGHEFYSKASHTIHNTNLSGDCDDFAVLLYSLITSIGGEARIIFAFDQNSGHAFTEVNIKDFSLQQVESVIRNRFFDYEIDDIHYINENGQIWLNLDWWAAYPGGKYMDFINSMVFYPNENNCN